MMKRENVEPFLRSTFKTEVTSLSTIATSPAMTASSRVLVNAAQGIQSHARIDDCAMLFHAQVIATYRDLVYRASFAPGRASAYISHAMALYRPERSSPTV